MRYFSVSWIIKTKKGSGDMLEILFAVFFLLVIFSTMISVFSLLALGMVFLPILITILVVLGAYRLAKFFFGEDIAFVVLMISIICLLVCLLSCAAHCYPLDCFDGYGVFDEAQTVTVAPKAPDEFGFWFSRGRIINVPDDNTFETNLEGARLDWYDDAINEEKFPFTKSDAGTKEAFIMGRDGIITYDFAMNEIGNRGLRPATLQEALAFIRMYPQRPGTEMLIMGQSWLGRGGIWYARYRVSGTGASLDAFSFDPRVPWFDVCFLAVRY